MKKRTRVKDRDTRAGKPLASKESSSSVRITPQGKVTVVSYDRRESRFSDGGVVFLQSTGGRQIRAIARDLSLHGVGIKIPKKLKCYGIGARMEIEFAYPHKLWGLLIEVELRRVREDERGYNDCGFEIVSSNKLLTARLRDMISSIERSDPWKSSV